MVKYLRDGRIDSVLLRLHPGRPISLAPVVAWSLIIITQHHHVTSTKWLQSKTVTISLKCIDTVHIQYTNLYLLYVNYTETPHH